MLVFLLSVAVTSERRLFGPYGFSVPVGYQPSLAPAVPEGLSNFDADGRVWLAKAYGQNYENFNMLRGDSSGFIYDAQTQSYVPVVTHNGVPKEIPAVSRPRPTWWSRVFFVTIGIIAFAKRMNAVTPLLVRYALPLAA